MKMDEYEKVKNLTYTDYCEYLKHKYGLVTEECLSKITKNLPKKALFSDDDPLCERRGSARQECYDQPDLSILEEVTLENGLSVHDLQESTALRVEKTSIESYPYKAVKRFFDKGNLILCDALEHLLLHIMIFNDSSARYPWQPDDDPLSKIALLIDAFSGWKPESPELSASYSRVAEEKDVLIELVKQFLNVGAKHGVYITVQGLYENGLDFLSSYEWNRNLNISLQNKILAATKGTLWQCMNVIVRKMIVALSQEHGEKCRFVKLQKDKLYYRIGKKSGLKHIDDFSKQVLTMGCVDADRYLTAVLSGATGSMFDKKKLYEAIIAKEPGFDFGTTWTGNHIEAPAVKTGNDFCLRFSCSFQLKPGCDPFIKITDNPYYDRHELLKDSIPTVAGVKGAGRVDPSTHETVSDEVTLVMSSSEIRQFKQCYTYRNIRILDGVYFHREGERLFI